MPGPNWSSFAIEIFQSGSPDPGSAGPNYGMSSKTSPSGSAIGHGRTCYLLNITARNGKGELLAPGR
jgi:hypothetical protein